MKTNKLVMALLSVFTIAGCTGVNQDPLKEKSDAIKSAVDPSTKPVLIPALPPGSYSLILPDESIVFKIGKTTSYTLRLNTYLPDYDSTLSITNLEKFPGATFDSSTGIFSWNPPASSISALKSYDGFDAQIEITAVSKSLGTILKSNSTIRFFVESDATTLPSIKGVKFSSSVLNPLMIEEGTTRDLTILAEDMDGQDSAGMRPTLIFGGKLGQYITVRSTRYLASTNQWEFEVRTDLTGVDITKNIDTAPLNVQVLNRLNKTSVPYKVDFTVLTKFGAPLSTFDNTTVFKLGLPNSVAFTIYDSQTESIPTLSRAGNIPLGATITCEKSFRVFQQCRFEWTPTAIGVYTTTLEIETRSSSFADSRQPVKNTIAIAYKVQ